MVLLTGLVQAEDPSNLSTHDAMDEIVQDAVKENITHEPSKKTEKITPSLSAAEMCAKIGGKLRSVDPMACQNFNLQATGAHSVNGLPILIKEYPPQPSRPPQARVLLLGGIHGDEYSSVSIVFKWMEILDAHHSGLFHWRIVPLVNPDGLLREASQRTNAHGVDLNRNFPTTDWQRESRDYWMNKTNSDPRRYPGPAPLSEPESRWVAEEIERFRPNAIVSLHAPFGLLDFDGPPTTPPERLGALYLTLLGTYPGSLGRFAGIQKKLPIITIELPFAGVLPNPTEITSMWSDMVQWIRGHVYDRKPRKTLTLERPRP
ncbi:MAG: murein peptide amidase A [Magnetococcales bacterium]|nr:murein peptide amidase A [Magnetococcales bacterium]